MKVDYSAAAELFMPTTRGVRRRPLGYRRFATAADAIRFAMEDLPAMHSFGPWMQVGDERFNTEAIPGLEFRSKGHRASPPREGPLFGDFSAPREGRSAHPIVLAASITG
jgi:hypothetical protein